MNKRSLAREWLWLVACCVVTGLASASYTAFTTPIPPRTAAPDKPPDWSVPNRVVRPATQPQPGYQPVEWDVSGKPIGWLPPGYKPSGWDANGKPIEWSMPPQKPFGYDAQGKPIDKTPEWSQLVPLDPKVGDTWESD